MRRLMRTERVTGWSSLPKWREFKIFTRGRPTSREYSKAAPAASQQQPEPARGSHEAGAKFDMERDVIRIILWLLRWLSWPWPAESESGEWRRPEAEQAREQWPVATRDSMPAEGWTL